VIRLRSLKKLLNLKAVFYSYWAIPLIASALGFSSIASIYLQLFPIPDYVSALLPYAVGANIILILCQLIFNRRAFVKTVLCSIVPLGIFYFWFLQTA